MKRLILITIVICFIFSTISFAADYPNKPVTIVNPWSPGGGSGVMSRIISVYLEKYLGTPVVVINKEGAGGEVGFAYIYNSKPDGYTIGLTNLPNFISFTLMRETKYKWEEFKPLINVVTDPGVLAINADDKRFTNLKEFLAYAKEHPNQITISNSGTGGDDYVATIALESKADVKFIKVPFGGGGPARTALLGGHVDACALNASEAGSFVEAGQLIVLGVMSEERYVDLPEVPTFNELGYEIYGGSSRGISAPPNTPDEIVNIIGEAFRKAANDPEFLKQAKEVKMPLDIKILDEYTALRARYNNTISELYEIYHW